MTRRSLLLAAKLACSALLLWLVLAKVEVGGITAHLRQTDPRWLLAALALGPVVIVLSAWRWRILSLGLLGFGEAVRYTWIGLFFGTILPGVIGGDLAKGVSLAAKQRRSRDPRLPVSIMVDKVIGFWVLLLQFGLAAFVLLALQPQMISHLANALWFAGLATFAGLSAGGMLWHPRGVAWLQPLAGRLPGALRRLAGQALAAVASYGGQGRVLRSAILLSAAIHGLNAVCLWLVMKALAIPAGFWFAAGFYPLLSVLLALPLSVSGIGVRDVFAASMFTVFGLRPDSGVAFSWLLLGLSVPTALVGGCIQLWEMFHRGSTD
ncbi:MAG TPA: lysylphosphatidylglycerol synthase transmembrane domain-containing protein [Opitutaceae bacterium]|nr:lysylphosphatidylglycerol synthase transmembrane domain-containing protein [Opitutaceae bacterium]